MSKWHITSLDEPILTVESEESGKAEFYKTDQGILFLSATSGRSYPSLSEALNAEVGWLNRAICLSSQVMPVRSLKNIARNLLAADAPRTSVINGQETKIKSKTIH